ELGHRRARGDRVDGDCFAQAKGNGRRRLVGVDGDVLVARRMSPLLSGRLETLRWRNRNDAASDVRPARSPCRGALVVVTITGPTVVWTGSPYSPGEEEGNPEPTASSRGTTRLPRPAHTARRRSRTAHRARERRDCAPGPRASAGSSRAPAP